jgi:hypothetical protein
LAAEELAGARAADEFAGVDYGAAAGQHSARHAFDANALEHGVIDPHVVRFRADDFFVVGIEDDEVGIGTYGDGAFPRIQTEEFCGSG